uniref:Uncharacterized protein n=1 Tax=Candidatus Kentrum sp. TC TaxID=2126339 RepID=A0A451A2T6_9GAMM|nr:MAG: hypothetical protein BECKTC1821F_GA0114240_10455 [Candidatus Kentron sp. TC]
MFLVIIAGMRDGTFKSAPLFPKWRSVCRSIERKADHGDRLRDRIEDAILDDARKCDLPEMTRKAHAILVSKQGSLFDIGSEFGPLSGLPIPPEPQLEKFFQDALRYEVSSGTANPKEIVTRATKTAIRSHVEAMNREINGHAAKACVDDLHSIREVKEALRNGCSRVNVARLVQDITEGRKPDSRTKKSPKYDLEEDLR